MGQEDRPAQFAPVADCAFVELFANDSQLRAGLDRARRLVMSFSRTMTVAGVVRRIATLDFAINLYLQNSSSGP